MKGPTAEMLFDYLATQKGLLVSRPLADGSYDRIVDHDGKLTRVQIKCTTCQFKWGWRVKTSRCTGKTRSLYTDKADVLAIHLEPVDTWVFIPVGEITGLWSYINTEKKHRSFVNNWQVFYEEKN